MCLYGLRCGFFFFFKQKTAYGLRIIDWSSDVCSSDLPASNVGIGDIVVTAQRRAENVQQVPIAVAAFSGAALQEKGVDNVSQLANLTPGVQLSSTSQMFSSPSMLSGFIRGIGKDDFALNFDPGVDRKSPSLNSSH